MLLAGCAIELRDAGRKARETSLRELAGITGSLGKETEAFEDCAIAEPAGVLHKQRIVAVCAREISRKAISDMLDAAAKFRLVEHVDDCAMHVGDEHTAAMPPDRLGAKYLFSGRMLQREGSAVPDLMSLAQYLSRHHDNVLEYLLCQIPMLCRRAPADVARQKQRRHENPRIGEHLVRAKRIDSDRRIGSSADPVEPALLHPSGQPFSGLGARQLQDALNITDMDNVSGTAQHRGKLRAAFW